MQFSFMPERETINAVYTLRRLKEKYHAKGNKLYTYVVVLEKAVDRAQRIVLEWAMRRKGIPQVFVRSMMMYVSYDTYIMYV